MAETPGAPHDAECSHATGNICVCACRGALHGVAVHAGAGRITRMAEVSVKGAKDGADVAAHADTAAQRQAHPVVVTHVEHDTTPVHVGPEVTATSSRVPGDLTGLSDDELMHHFHAAAEAGSDHDAQRVFDEMGRREDAAAAAKPRYSLPAPVHELSDEQLAQAAHDAGDDAGILTAVYDEMDRREQEAARRAELAKTPPAAPAMVGSAIYEFEKLRGRGRTRAEDGDGAQLDRVQRAERLALGLDQDAPEQAVLDAAAADPRSAEDRSAWSLAWYRKLAAADGIGPHDPAYGPGDNPHMIAEAERRRAEQAAELARQQAIGAGPTAPARVVNPIAEWGDVKQMAQGYRDTRPGQLAAERIREAQIRTLGLDPAADDKAIRAAARADPRSPADKATQYLTWYRHLGQHSDLGTETPADWARGPADQPGAVAPLGVPHLAPANVAKPWDTWQAIKDQAKADKDNGNPGTWERYVAAMKQGYGMSPDVADHQVGRAHRHDERTKDQQAAGFIAAYRELNARAGVDPSDTLRYGPPDRNAGRGKKLPTQHRETNPEQERRIDDLVSRGWDYLDAYADVHNLDPAALKAEQAAGAARGGAGGSTEQAVRRQYDEHVHLAYIQAEQATRGHLLSKAGKAAGIDPVALFSGPTARARKYASEDLLRHWSDTGSRMTYQQFRAQVLGRASDKAAARVTAGAAQGKDFA